MAKRRDGEFREVVRSAVAEDGIESAVIYVVGPGSPVLQLGAAAGVAGPALDGLTAAVQNPAHPINRAMTDDGPTFDVRPTAPGGPALRSHLPLVGVVDRRRAVVGVLAVAHDRSLTPDQRETLVRLAEAAAEAASEP